MSRFLNLPLYRRILTLFRNKIAPFCKEHFNFFASKTSPHYNPACIMRFLLPPQHAVSINGLDARREEDMHAFYIFRFLFNIFKCKKMDSTFCLKTSVKVLK